MTPSQSSVYRFRRDLHEQVCRLRMFCLVLQDITGPLVGFGTLPIPQKPRATSELLRIGADRLLGFDGCKRNKGAVMTKSKKGLALSSPADFVAGLGRDQLAEILGAAELWKMRAGEIILREGAAPAHLFLLNSGHAKFYRLTDSGGEVMLHRLSPGDVFGLGTLLVRPVPYIGTAETTRESELLVWKQARIRALAQKYPRLAQNGLSIVLRYLATHFDRLVDLVTLTAGERLARVVIHLGKQAGIVIPTGVEISATNDE